jgi:hypothetical protein
LDQAQDTVEIRRFLILSKMACFEDWKEAADSLYAAGEY